MTVGVSNIDLGQRASILVLLTESDRCRSQRGAQAWLGLITKLAFWNWKSSEPLLANQIQNVSIRGGICMSEGLILPLRLPPRIVPEDNGPNRDSHPTGGITSWVLGCSRIEIRLLLTAPPLAMTSVPVLSRWTKKRTISHTTRAAARNQQPSLQDAQSCRPLCKVRPRPESG